jgi:hypothetical protein
MRSVYEQESNDWTLLFKACTDTAESTAHKTQQFVSHKLIHNAFLIKFSPYTYKHEQNK